MSKLLENIYAECFNPVKVKMYDPIERTDVVREVPCGKCYHCKITKINEWVTRMVIQSMYSKYVYFGTLTYAVTKTNTFYETYPNYSTFNQEGKYLPTPLVLCKSHLQKFFKRLRKYIGIKFQYFACGEYGTKYGRPHFHYIMWSDLPITENQIAHSWSEIVDGERISLGRIEHQDMRKDAINIEHSYKYVCKYLQKTNFNYNELVTKKLHDENIKTNFIGCKCTDEVFYESKKQYIETYRPFILCSKRPAIGSQYFEEYSDEFEKGNFKLFSLKGDYVFPSYYFRKTREKVCPYKTISVKNGKPNSYSNLPTVVSLLVELQNAIKFNQDFLCSSPLVRCNFEDYTVTFPARGQGSRNNITLSARYFNFYDVKNKYYYYLREDGRYDVCVKRWDKLYDVDMQVVINELQHTYNKLFHSFLFDMHEKSKVRRLDKLQQIENEFGTYDDYIKERQKVIDNLLQIIDVKQDRYKQTKNQF